MADPLSVVASIAGIVTAGLTISSGLYAITDRIKSAPEEVSDMAKELSMLSAVLQNLRSEMKHNIHLCKSSLILKTRDMVSKIRRSRDAKQLTNNSGSSLYSLKLRFRGPKTKRLMGEIEAFKLTLNVILATVQLAALRVERKKSEDTISASVVTELRRLLQSLLVSSTDSMVKMYNQGINNPYEAMDDFEPYSTRRPDSSVVPPSARRPPRSRGMTREPSKVVRRRSRSRSPTLAPPEAATQSSSSKFILHPHGTNVTSVKRDSGNGNEDKKEELDESANKQTGKAAEGVLAGGRPATVVGYESLASYSDSDSDGDKETFIHIASS